MIETLISFAFATLVLAISPGPDNVFVLTQSIVSGKKFGLAVVLGLMTGCLVHTTLVAFGMSSLIKNNENIFFTIKLFGASYLLYLAFKIYKGSSEIVFTTEKKEEKTILQLFKTGFLMNVLNPKVTLFFLAFFPQFLFSEEISTVLQFYILGFLFVLISFLIFGAIAILGEKISEYLTKHKKIGFFLKWAQIIVFVAIAVLLFV